MNTHHTMTDDDNVCDGAIFNKIHKKIQIHHHVIDDDRRLFNTQNKLIKRIILIDIIKKISLYNMLIKNPHKNHT